MAFCTEMIYLPQRLSLAIQDTIAKAGEAVNEAVSGIRVVRSFNTEKHEACRYDNCLMDIHVLKTRRDTLRAVYLLVYRVMHFTFSFFYFTKLCFA